MSPENFILETVALEENVGQVMGFLQQRGQECGLEPALLSKFELACEELFVNVIMHGSPPGGPGPAFTLILAVDDDSVCMTLEDEGIAFNPLEHQVQDLDAELDDRQIGGLGIYLVCELMDDVRYERSGQTNRMTMVKSRADQDETGA